MAIARAAARARSLSVREIVLPYETVIAESPRRVTCGGVAASFPSVGKGRDLDTHVQQGRTDGAYDRYGVVAVAVGAQRISLHGHE